MAIIGSVEVEVVPSAQGIDARMQAIMDPAAVRAGESAGRQFAQSFQAQLSGINLPSVAPGATRQGAEAGDGFSRAFRERVDAALRNLPTPTVGINADPAQAELEGLANRIRLVQGRIGVDLSDADALAQLRILQDRLDRLAASSANVRVRVDAAGASAQLAALQAQVAAAGGTVNTNVNSSGLAATAASASQASSQMHLLRDAIILLGPALVPIAGAALALGAGLVAAGAAGILAFKGIQSEMKAGTVLGDTFGVGVQTIENDLSALERTAANGVLAGFQASVQTLDAAFPSLNSNVSAFSGKLGDIASHSITGIVAGFQLFAPLALQVLTYVDRLASTFATWAGGPGGAGFVTTLSRQFAQVMPVLEQIVLAVARLIGAFAQAGGVILPVLGSIVSLINALPVGVLTALADAFVPLYGVVRLTAIFGGVNAAFLGTTTAAAGLRAALAASQVGILAAASSATAAGGSLSRFGAITAGARAGVTTFASSLSTLGVVAIAAIAVLGALAIDKGIASNFKETAKSVDQVTASLQTIGQGASFTADEMKILGASGKSLHDILHDTFKESNFTAIANFGSSLAPWSTDTDKASNAIKALDSGLANLAKTDPTAASAAFQKIADTASAEGISIDQLKAKFPQYTAGLNDVLVVNLATAGAQLTNANSLQAVADSLGVTTSQAQKYADVLGITADQIKAGVGTNAELQSEITGVKNAYASASDSLNTFLGAMTTFGASGKSAADVGTLIAATLVAGNGDALSYGTAITGTTTAINALTDAFKTVKGVSFADSERGAIQFTTAVGGAETASINYAARGAPALVQQLDQMQTAAAAASKATFQHQVSIGNAAGAADAASKVFNDMTAGALVANQKQLKITGAQAQELANTYFSMPPDVTTAVHQIGMDAINDTLNQIGEQLSVLTGKPWNVATAAPNAPITQADLVAVGAAAGKIPAQKDINVAANTAAAVAGINSLVAYADAQRATIHVSASTILQPDGSTLQLAGGRLTVNLEGSITNVNGNFKAFADGGFNNVAQVAPAGSNILFAEQGTGGESFIPWAASKRERSTEILAQTAAGFGYGLTSGSSNDELVAELRAMHDDLAAGLAAVGAVVQQSTTDQTTKLTLASSLVRRVNAS